MPAPLWLQWAARHGVIRIALRRAARRGELQARLMIDPDARDNPFPLYDRLRAGGPLIQGGLTLVAPSHEASSAVLRSDVFRVGLALAAVPRFLRGALIRPPDGRSVGPIDPPSLLAVNPPEHTRYRRRLAGVFTPRAIAALEPRVAQIAAELLEALAGQDVVDLVPRYCALLPVTVISEVLGIPLQHRDQFLRWGNAAAAVLDVGLGYGEFRQGEAAIRDLNGWIYEHIQRLRRQPGADLLSTLITLEDGGQPMSDLELVATAGLLLAAGFETTVNLLGSGAHLLLRHPDQLELLRREPALWGNAVEEILRYESPVQNTARYAGADTELLGRQIPRGTLVSVLIGAANRDPAIFEEPNRFDVRRANAREHLAFSAGVHYCIGAALARLEGRVGLRVLLERHPDLVLAGTAVRRPTRTLRGYQRLPVRLGAVAPGAAGGSAPDPAG